MDKNTQHQHKGILIKRESKYHSEVAVPLQYQPQQDDTSEYTNSEIIQDDMNSRQGGGGERQHIQTVSIRDSENASARNSHMGKKQVSYNLTPQVKESTISSNNYSSVLRQSGIGGGPALSSMKRLLDNQSQPYQYQNVQQYEDPYKYAGNHYISGISSNYYGGQQFAGNGQSFKSQRGEQANNQESFYQDMNSRGITTSLMVQEDTCQTCGLKLSHWYHYYSDIYGPFLFHRCPKLSVIAQQLPQPQTGDCCYHFKFILWFILMPILTLLALIMFVYCSFKTFLFQPVHFEFSNMNRQQQKRWKCPIYSLYVLLSLVLFMCVLFLPIILTPFCVPLAYFVHVFSYIEHRRFRKIIENQKGIKKNQQWEALIHRRPLEEMQIWRTA